MFPVLNFLINLNNINGAKDKKNENINKSCSQLKLLFIPQELGYKERNIWLHE